MDFNEFIQPKCEKISLQENKEEKGKQENARYQIFFARLKH
jgi:hypothetical protein